METAICHPFGGQSFEMFGKFVINQMYPDQRAGQGKYTTITQSPLPLSNCGHPVAGARDFSLLEIALDWRWDSPTFVLAIYRVVKRLILKLPISLHLMLRLRMSSSPLCLLGVDRHSFPLYSGWGFSPCDTCTSTATTGTYRCPDGHVICAVVRLYTLYRPNIVIYQNRFAGNKKKSVLQPRKAQQELYATLGTYKPHILLKHRIYMFRATPVINREAHRVLCVIENAVRGQLESVRYETNFYIKCSLLFSL